MIELSPYSSYLFDGALPIPIPLLYLKYWEHIYNTYSTVSDIWDHYFITVLYLFSAPGFYSDMLTSVLRCFGTPKWQKNLMSFNPGIVRKLRFCFECQFFLEK